MQGMSFMGKKGEGGTCGNATKGVAKEKAGTPCKGRSAGKKVEEGETGGGGASYKGKSTARRVEEEFVGDVKEEGGMVLWTNSATRCGVVGAGMAQLRSCCHVSEVPKIWQRGIVMTWQNS